MTPLKAVVAELSRFVFVEWFGFRSLPAPPMPMYLESLKRPSLPAPRSSATPTTVGESAYIITSHCPLECFPTETYDGVIAWLSYGTLVMVVDRRNHWVQVRHGDHLGWVRAECLEVEQAVVWPKLEPERIYECNAAATRAIRLATKDTFALERLQLPLQDSEYCVYRLCQQGITLHWPVERPRLPGRWHVLLKDIAGTHSSIRPEPGAIMEWLKNDEEGQVAYVESVAENDTITISTVGLTTPGEYTIHTFSHTMWREYRPVFITVRGNLPHEA